MATAKKTATKTEIVNSALKRASVRKATASKELKAHLDKADELAVPSTVPVMQDAKAVADEASLVTSLNLLLAGKATRRLKDEARLMWQLREVLKSTQTQLQGTLINGGVSDATGALTMEAYRNVMELLGLKELAKVPNPGPEVRSTRSMRRAYTRGLVQVLQKGINAIDESVRTIGAYKQAGVKTRKNRAVSVDIPRTPIVETLTVQRMRGRSVTHHNSHLFVTAGYICLAVDHIAKIVMESKSLNEMTKAVRDRTASSRQRLLPFLAKEVPVTITEDNIFIQSATGFIDGHYEVEVLVRYPLGLGAEAIQGLKLKVYRDKSIGAYDRVMQHTSGVTNMGREDITALVQHAHRQLG